MSRSSDQEARSASGRATPSQARGNDLCPETWREFIGGLLSRRVGQALRINGQRLNETQQRALHRWRNEGCSPSIFAADRFLTAAGLHLSDYFVYCQVNGLRAWALGVPPAWHEEDWWWQDHE